MSYQKSQMSFKVFIGVMLAVLGILTFFPFLWMIFSSLKTNAEISQMVPTLLPKNPTLNNFKELFERLNFGSYLKNTLIVTLFSFLGLFLNAMAGYGFSKYDFKGKHGLFLLVLATMMIPGQVTMIPVYLILNSVGLTNTLMGIVLPGLAGYISFSSIYEHDFG